MRYVIQALAITPVLGFTIYSAWLLYTDRRLVNVLWIIVICVLLILTGFFDCWKPSIIKRFLKNSKKIGL